MSNDEIHHGTIIIVKVLQFITILSVLLYYEIKAYTDITWFLTWARHKKA